MKSQNLRRNRKSQKKIKKTKVVKVIKKSKVKKEKVKKQKEIIFTPTELLLIHPTESSSAKALRTVPKDLIQKTVGTLTENFILIENLANRIEINQNQFSAIYERLKKICSFLKIPVPRIFLEMNVVPKSNVQGIENPYIIINSALVELLTLDELETELACCCGHIFLNHYYYKTIADAITKMGLGIVGSVLYYPFSYWKNCIEFSADRVAAVYKKSSEPVKNLLLKYAGITEKTKNYVDIDSIIEQAKIIQQYSKTNELFAKLTGKSPILRIYELQEWSKTQDLEKLITYFEHERTYNSIF